MIGRAAAVVALTLAAGVHPVAAQEAAPKACADAKEQVRYLVNEGALFQEAGLREGLDLLATSIIVRNAACSTPGDDSLPPPAPETPPTPAPVPVPTPFVAPSAPIADDANSATRRDACLLITVKEVGAAMKQGIVANEADPAGATGAQGCEFNGVVDAYTDVMYFQANASTVYDMFHATAEADGVQAVPGLGDVPSAMWAVTHPVWRWPKAKRSSRSSSVASVTVPRKGAALWCSPNEPSVVSIDHGKAVQTLRYANQSGRSRSTAGHAITWPNPPNSK